MQEVFEMITERLEENQTIVFHLEGGKPTQSIDIVKAIEIVKQTAEEYDNGCKHKWVFQEKQLKTEVSGYEFYTAHYQRTDVYFCEKCCEIKKVEQKESVSLPFGGIHHLQKYAPIWYKQKGE